MRLKCVVKITFISPMVERDKLTKNTFVMTYFRGFLLLIETAVHGKQK